jgi:hypothetical protein
MERSDIRDGSYPLAKGRSRAERGPGCPLRSHPGYGAHLMERTICLAETGNSASAPAKRGRGTARSAVEGAFGVAS